MKTKKRRRTFAEKIEADLQALDARWRAWKNLNGGKKVSRESVKKSAGQMSEASNGRGAR